MEAVTLEFFQTERAMVECTVPSFSRDPAAPRKVKVRALEIREVADLRDACGSYPQPPMKAPEDKGSDAAKVADVTDLDYVKRERKWNRLFSLGKIAMAINYQPRALASFAEAQSKTAWVVEVERELGVLSDVDVDRLLRAVNEAAGADVDAKKF